VAHDLHPEYASTLYGRDVPANAHVAVQHHKAHIASVLAERGAWDRRAVGIAFDGTGYGEDGQIWGGEVFRGSLAEGFTRTSHLRTALLIGGDAAARVPVQCAAGFLAQLEDLPDLQQPPFGFPQRYIDSLHLARARIRRFETSSMGRLFDTVAALCGFTREISFEGQAAMWLEHLAQKSMQRDAYGFPVTEECLDFRPLLATIVEERLKGKDPAVIASRFHHAVARAAWKAAEGTCEANSIDLVVLSGGVFQNELLLSLFASLSRSSALEVWSNGVVPTNDGGVSFGQAAMASLGSINRNA
jgi:hydrogenase maturation protein HypF